MNIAKNADIGWQVLQKTLCLTIKGWPGYHELHVRKVGDGCRHKLIFETRANLSYVTNSHWAACLRIRLEFLRIHSIRH